MYLRSFENTAVDDACKDALSDDALDLDADVAVAQENVGPRNDVTCQWLIGRSRSLCRCVARDVLAAEELQDVAFLELDRLLRVGQGRRAHLRAAEVLENGYRTTDRRRFTSNGLETRKMFALRAMAKVEANDVHCVVVIDGESER